jgi:hypothetical protein
MEPTPSSRSHKCTDSSATNTCIDSTENGVTIDITISSIWGNTERKAFKKRFFREQEYLEQLPMTRDHPQSTTSRDDFLCSDGSRQ